MLSTFGGRPWGHLLLEPGTKDRPSDREGSGAVLQQGSLQSVALAAAQAKARALQAARQRL